MNAEDDEAMRALDERLRRLCGSLDTSPGFEDRLQARIASMATAPAQVPLAAAREHLEQQHERARAAAHRAARMDAAAVAIGGIGSALALWRFAPQVTAWYATSVETLGPTFIGFGSLAITAFALWALLKRLDVSPRSLVGA